jgi:hypothetical protein
MDTNMENKMRTDRLRLQNSAKAEITLHLEPWGEQLRMPAGTTFEVVVTGPDRDCMEVVFEGDNVFVYAWTGSVIAVFENEREVFSCNLRVPPLPGDP